MQKKKIAVLSRYASIMQGGAERYSLEVSKILAEKYDITYFSQNWDEIPTKVDLHPVPKLFTKRMRWLNHLWFACYTWIKTRGKYDVIHSHEMVFHGDIHVIHCPPVKNKLVKANSFIKKAYRYFQIATSFRQMAYFGLERGQFKYEPCKKIIAVSNLTLDEIQKAYPQSSSMFQIILPGIKGNYPSIDLNDISQCAERKLKLLFVAANNFHIKGLDTLLKALSLVNVDFHLDVVGGGDIKHYQQKVESLGLSGKVDFKGFQTEMNNFYAVSDALILPTHEDTFSMIVLEAMFAGLPTIISNDEFCGIATHLSDQETFKLRNPYDAEELAEKITDLVENPHLASQVAQKGQEFALEHTWEKCAEKFAELYEQVIKCKQVN